MLEMCFFLCPCTHAVMGVVIYPYCTFIQLTKLCHVHHYYMHAYEYLYIIMLSAWQELG